METGELSPDLVRLEFDTKWGIYPTVPMDITAEAVVGAGLTAQPVLDNPPGAPFDYGHLTVTNNG